MGKKTEDELICDIHNGSCAKLSTEGRNKLMWIFILDHCCELVHEGESINGFIAKCEETLATAKALHNTKETI